MKTLRSLFILTIVLTINGLIFNQCSSREETVSCFPNSNINVTLNLSLPAYQTLQNVGGWLYINEQESGTRGLIVVRTTNGFLAYDRNAPHICPDSDTTLNVENDIKIICPNDGAEWILITGEPVAVANVSPKKYYTYYDASSQTLNITN